MSEEYIFKSCYKGDRSVVEKLLSSGYSINIVDDEGKTPLTVAIESIYTDYEFVHYLIGKGANVNYYAKVDRKNELDAPIIPSKLQTKDKKLTDMQKWLVDTQVWMANIKKCIAPMMPTYTIVSPMMIAIKSGSKNKIDILLQAGANIKYVNNLELGIIHDFCAKFSRDSSQWMEDTLKKLLDAGCTDFGANRYGESALKFAIEYGNLKMTRLLLKYGAPAKQINWTKKHIRAIFDGVKAIKQDLELFNSQSLDIYKRTPLMLFLQFREPNEIKIIMTLTDISKIKHTHLLNGLMSMVKCEDKEKIQMILEIIRLSEKDELTILDQAVKYGAYNCIQFMLENNTKLIEPFKGLIENAKAFELLKLFRKYEVDFSFFNTDQKKEYFKYEDNRLIRITLEELIHFGEPREGISNPEIIQNNFYTEMIITNASPSKVNWQFENDKYVPDKKKKYPRLWTNNRLGQTITELKDGRTIFIGGEYEDFYDPFFYIFNDIIIYEPNGEKKVLLYPYKDFPPTDFHTATLIGNQIYIIGRMGFDIPEDGSTPVYILNTDTYKLRELKIRNKIDGCVNSHQSELTSNGIIIHSGKILAKNKNMTVFTEKYLLNIKESRWIKL